MVGPACGGATGTGEGGGGAGSLCGCRCSGIMTGWTAAGAAARSRGSNQAFIAPLPLYGPSGMSPHAAVVGGVGAEIRTFSADRPPPIRFPAIALRQGRLPLPGRGDGPPSAPGLAGTPGAPTPTAPCCIVVPVGLAGFSFCAAVPGTTAVPTAGPDVIPCCCACTGSPTANEAMNVLAAIRAECTFMKVLPW